ncbi:hypothetical protein NDU88_007857 [Pleurodeles waltl]|uniref:Uncharacterized protein n=1 Tax=Pleurodeles waltl TaxID=8319 RepID=A0AAV7VU28_PLEWA|nr:hypothetical protein NDU88_007857 [Pleurodeles waltl]
MGKSKTKPSARTCSPPSKDSIAQISVSCISPMAQAPPQDKLDFILREIQESRLAIEQKTRALTTEGSLIKDKHRKLVGRVNESNLTILEPASATHDTQIKKLTQQMELLHERRHLLAPRRPAPPQDKLDFILREIQESRLAIEQKTRALTTEGSLIKDKHRKLVENTGTATSLIHEWEAFKVVIRGASIGMLVGAGNEIMRALKAVENTMASTEHAEARGEVDSAVL